MATTVGICNVGVGGRYPAGSRRLSESLAAVGIPWRQFILAGRYPDGSPTHEQAPYAFKLHALAAAARDGCDIVLWADSAVWAIRDAAPLIGAVERRGYYFVHSGFSYGQWTSDACLAAMGETRTDASHDAALSPMIMACFYAVDLRRTEMRQFLEEVRHWTLANDGALLRGAWTNDRRQVSEDPRCSGHRHDQSILSILIKRWSLTIDVPHETYFQYYDDHGHHVGDGWRQVDIARFAPSISFLSQGY
jgi:hypothetical protein